eukprot:UN13427
MLIMGSAPFRSSNSYDPSFQAVINGDIGALAKIWHREEFLNQELIDLLEAIFVFEEKRINLQQIKESKFLS